MFKFLQNCNFVEIFKITLLYIATFHKYLMRPLCTYDFSSIENVNMTAYLHKLYQINASWYNDYILQKVIMLLNVIYHRILSICQYSSGSRDITPPQAAVGRENLTSLPEKQDKEPSVSQTCQNPTFSAHELPTSKYEDDDPEYPRKEGDNISEYDNLGPEENIYTNSNLLVL